MRVIAMAKGPALVWGASGTKHVFAQNADGTYSPPPGVNYSLTWDGVNQVYKITTLDNTVYTFDSSGWLIKITDSNNQNTTFTRNAYHSVTGITDPSNRALNVYYDGNGYVDHINDPAGRTITYHHDTSGNLDQVTVSKDSKSNTIQYGYSSGTHTMISATDPNNKTISFTYNSGKVATVTRTINGSNSTNTYTYGTVGVQSTGTISESLGRSTTYTFNDNGNVVKSEVTKDAQGNKLTTTFDWDVYHNLNSVTDPNNHKTDFSYNDKGQIVSSTDANGLNTSFNYDANNNLISSKNPKGSVSASSFNTNNNQTEVFDPLGNGPLNDYDSYGNLQSSTLPISLGENLVYNPGFEDPVSGIPGGWVASRTLGGGDVLEVDSTTKAGGYRSVKITSASSAGLGARSYYYIPVIPGASYNLSAYLKTDSSSTGVLRVYWYQDASGTPSATPSTVDLSATNGATSWGMKATQLFAPTDANYAKVEAAVNGTGTAWFDNVQLESGSGRMGNNILINPGFDFDLDQTGLADGWYPPNPNPGGISIDFSNFHSGTASEKMIGEASVSKYVYHSYDMFGDAGSKLAFSGWGKSVGGSTGADRCFCMIVSFNYDDQTSDWHQINFDPTNSNWHQVSDVIKASKPFHSITVWAQYANQTGTAWFDDFEVHKYNTVSAVPSAYNYAENSSFEQDYDASGWPDGWYKTWESGKSATFNWTGLNKSYSGSHSVSIANPTGWASITLSGRKVPFNPSTDTYTAVGYIKTENVSSSAVLIIHAYNSSGDWIGEVDSSTVTSNKNWTRASVVINSANAPQNTASIAVGVQMRAGTGTSYFDNVRLMKGEVRSQYSYNTAGNYVTSIKDQIGNTLTLSPDANTGNITSVTDPKGNNFSYTYDYLNRMETATYPYQATIGGEIVNKTFSYQYDNNGNLTKTTDPNSHAIDMEYNEINELKSISEAVSGTTRTTSMTYDALGNLTRIDYANGTYTTFDYDKANRVTGLNYNKDGTPTVSYTIAYDDAGNPTSFVKDSQTTTFDYDNLNQLTRVTEPGGTNKVEYTYDAAGNQTKTSETVGGSLAWSAEYTYDERGNVTKIKDVNPDKSTFYLYNESGQLIKTYNQLNNYGVSSFYSYNNAGQLTEIRVQNASGATTDLLDYTYDANGNVERVDDLLNGKSVTYEYDTQNQLVRETYRTGETVNSTITYTYDELGNRTSVNDNGNITNYSYNTEKNRLNAVGSANYSYDNAGNLISDGTNTYQWNNANELKQVNSNITYTYDPLGRRDSKTVNGTTEYYHFDGNRVAYVSNSGGTVIRRFTYDDDGRPVFMGQNGTIYYYQYNAHGDVVKMTDLSGNIVAEYKYDAWGNITYQNGSLADDNPYRYAGYWYDNETGSYYLNTRYYNPQIGRFISKDTYGGLKSDPVTQNRYAYGKNNPVNYVDENGTFAIAIPIIAEGLVAFVESVIVPIAAIGLGLFLSEGNDEVINEENDDSFVSDNEGDWGHIVEEHGPDSTSTMPDGKSPKSKYYNKNDIKKIARETRDNPTRKGPNTSNDKKRKVQDTEFNKPIGTDYNGNPTNWNRVVLNRLRRIISSFPIPPK